VPVLGISQELDAEAELIGTLKRDSPTGGGSRPMVAVAPTVTASWGHHGHSSPRGDGTDPIVPVASALTAREGKGPDSDATTTLIPVPTADLERPVAFKVRGGKPGGGKGYLGSEDKALTISTVQEQYLAEPIAVDTYNQTTGSATHTLRDPIATTYAVRRLTPLECERLQGFPDGWTELGHYYEGFDRERLWNAKTRTRPKGEEAEAIVRKIADTHRYRMLGNAVTVNVAEWLGGRVAAALAVEVMKGRRP